MCTVSVVWVSERERERERGGGRERERERKRERDLPCSSFFFKLILELKQFRLGGLKSYSTYTMRA
jgi:hypothetical protein